MSEFMGIQKKVEGLWSALGQGFCHRNPKRRRPRHSCRGGDASLLKRF